MARTKLPTALLEWVEARRRFGLSHAQVQMARELGMNPKKLGSLANHHQEPWKAPLPRFIEDLYEKRFGRRAPVTVLSMEQLASAQAAKRDAKKAAKRARREAAAAQPGEALPVMSDEAPSSS